MKKLLYIFLFSYAVVTASEFRISNFTASPVVCSVGSVALGCYDVFVLPARGTVLTQHIWNPDRFQFYRITDTGGPPVDGVTLNGIVDFSPDTTKEGGSVFLYSLTGSYSYTGWPGVGTTDIWGFPHGTVSSTVEVPALGTVTLPSWATANPAMAVFFFGLACAAGIAMVRAGLKWFKRADGVNDVGD